MTTFIGDLEGNGLKFEITNIWCIVNYDREADLYHISVPGRWLKRKELQEVVPENTILYKNHVHHLMVMMQVDSLVYHNGINFDRMALRKLYPWWDCKQMEDTFVLSSLFNPDRPIPKGSKGPHSIDAWARRFKMFKPYHDDWTKFSPDMLHRCIEDVKIGCKTWDALTEERNKWDWEKAIALEYGVAKYHATQEMNGCPFDLKYALELLTKLDKEIKDLEGKILPGIPKRCKNPYNNPVNSPFKKDGEYSANLLKWFSKVEADKVKVSGPFNRIRFDTINLNSDQQVKNYLLTQGWQPTEWNYKKDSKTKRFVYDSKGKRIPTSPKLTEESYASIRSGIGQLLGRRNIILHRRRTIQNIKDPLGKGLISFIRSDGRIPAEAAPQATNTGRYRHKKIVNIPKAKKKIVYGREMRRLFYVG